MITHIKNHEAIHASKETSIASSGAIMNKDGSRALSTVAHGNRIPVFNTTDSSPICIHSNEFEAIKEGVLDGAKVILDIESEADGSEYRYGPRQPKFSHS